MTTNGFFFQSLLAHPFQEGYTHGRVCQGRTPSFEDKVGSRKRGQKLALLYFNNINGLISVTLAVVRSYRINFKEPIKFYVCTFYESYVSMEYDMKAIKMDPITIQNSNAVRVRLQRQLKHNVADIIGSKYWV